MSCITYNDLWCIYAPGTLIYGRDFLEQDRVWRVTKAEAQTNQDRGREYRIDAESAESDGKKLGLVVSNLIVAAYDGSVPIESLTYKPLHMMPLREQIWRNLLARAERQLSFLSTPYKIQHHEGEAIVHGHIGTPEWEQKEPQRYYVSRPKLYSKFDADSVIVLVQRPHHGRPYSVQSSRTSSPRSNNQQASQHCML